MSNHRSVQRPVEFVCAYCTPTPRECVRCAQPDARNVPPEPLSVAAKGAALTYRPMASAADRNKVIWLSKRPVPAPLSFDNVRGSDFAPSYLSPVPEEGVKADDVGYDGDISDHHPLLSSTSSITSYGTDSCEDLESVMHHATDVSYCAKRARRAICYNLLVCVILVFLVYVLVQSRALYTR